MDIFGNDWANVLGTKALTFQCTLLEHIQTMCGYPLNRCVQKPGPVVATTRFL